MSLEAEGRLWRRAALDDATLQVLDAACDTGASPGRRLLLEPPAALNALARELLPGARPVRVVAFNKSEAENWALPWHQDGGRFWGVDRDPFLQLWTALDDAGPDAGCLEFIPGTHAAGLATPLGGLVPTAMAAAREHEAVRLPAEAGEVILVHNHVWHRAGVNRSGRARRSFSVCYMSAETRCLRRKRAPRQFPRVFLAAKSEVF